MNGRDLTGVRWVSASAGDNSCVEAAGLPDGDVAVRNSKDPHGPVVCFTRKEWDVFKAGVIDGFFDTV